MILFTLDILQHRQNLFCRLPLDICRQEIYKHKIIYTSLIRQIIVIKMKFDLTKIKVSPEIARIHAHVCGDGSVYISYRKRSPCDLKKRNWSNIYRNEYTIEYYNNELELVFEFVNDFKISFNRNLKTIKNKVRFRNVKYIIEKLELSGKNSYNWYIPKFLMNSKEEIFCNWIRAFFDDESYIHPLRRRIVVKSMNKNGLLQIKSLLTKLKIRASVTGPNCDKSYYLFVHKEGLIIYRNKIGFLMKRKKLLLDTILE